MRKSRKLKDGFAISIVATGEPVVTEGRVAIKSEGQTEIGLTGFGAVHEIIVLRNGKIQFSLEVREDGELVLFDHCGTRYRMAVPNPLHFMPLHPPLHPWIKKGGKK